MANLTTIWNTGTMPVTIQVNGYTVTLERKEREQSDTRTRGLQTLYFGNIADSAGKVTAIDGKPLSWIKKRVGDDSVRAYIRCADGVRVSKSTILSDESIDSMCDSFRTALLRKNFADLCGTLAHWLKVPAVEVVSNESINIAVDLYRDSLIAQQRQQIADRADREKRAKVKQVDLTSCSPAQLDAILAILGK